MARDEDWEELLSRIRHERDQWKQIRERFDELQEEPSEQEWRQTRLLGALLEEFYTGCERLFTFVCERIDDETMDQPRWHTQLLRRMSEGKPHRPRILRSETHRELRRYLQLRHRVRNMYTQEFNYEEMKQEVEDFLKVYRMVLEDIQGFENHIQMSL